MSDRAVMRAVDAFKSCIPLHPARTNCADELGGLTVCAWNTPWIRGFRLPANDDLVIAYHREGRCDVRALHDDTVSLEQSEPGRLTAIPPEKDHGFQVAGEVSFETIHVPHHRIRAVAKRHSLGDRIPAFRFAFQDAFVGGCIAAILGEAREREPGPQSDEFIRSVTDSLLLHLLRSGSPASLRTPPPTSTVERTRALIAASLGDSLSLDDLAEEAGVSRSHLARRFRAETGLSPHRYKSVQRIEKAKQMLRESDMTLVDIAIELGFCSQSHFTQAFRAMVGMTPRRFRDEGESGGVEPA